MNIIRFFKKRQRKTKLAPAVLQQLQQKIEHYQRNAAAFMQQKASGLSKRKLYILLTLFCLTYGSLCLMVVFKKDTLFNQPHLSKSPAHIGTQIRDHAPSIDPATYRRIKAFSNYLDSLRQTPTGKKTYDSIIRHRPGLVDSLHEALKYYEE